MPTIAITYNPKVSAVFNPQGQLVVGDINTTDWGGFNPPKSSITSATFSLYNFVTGNSYTINGADFDLLAAGLYGVSDDIEIGCIEYNEITNIFTQSTEAISNSAFEDGIYLLSFSFAGTYTYGSDTINWTGGCFVSDAINTNSNCIHKILCDVAFAKKCKTSKKWKNIKRYLSMIYEYNQYITVDSLTILDSTKRQAKLSKILDEIKAICNGKNKCKC